MIRITQHRVKCIGCNACVEAASDRWIVSKKDGKCNLIGGREKRGFYSVQVSDDEFASNQIAAKNCPVNIIKIDQI